MNCKPNESFYQYVENQRENYTDLTDSKNESIVKIADILFNKSVGSLDQNLSFILLDESMDINDVFCMLIELTLRGLYIINPNNNIFELDDPYEKTVDIIRSYIKSTGFDITIKEEYQIPINYYCEIQPKPVIHLGYQEWYVLGYRIVCNDKVSFDNSTPLGEIKAYFVSDKEKIFSVQFRKISYLY